MDADVGGSGVRELVRIVGLATVGLLLAGLAAFTPWYAAVTNDAHPHVAELRPPGLTQEAG